MSRFLILEIKSVVQNEFMKAQELYKKLDSDFIPEKPMMEDL